LIRNVVFDMGGVLMDFHPLTACRAAAPDEAGARRLDDALFKHPLWGRLDDDSLTPEELGRLAEAALAEPALRSLIGKILDAMPYNMLSPPAGHGGGRVADAGAGYRVYLLSNAGRKISEHGRSSLTSGGLTAWCFRWRKGNKEAEPEYIPPAYVALRLKPGSAFSSTTIRATCGWRVPGVARYRFDGDVPALERARWRGLRGTKRA
jgi:hypothetical protein